MTPITPNSWIEKATPPIVIGRVENALGNVFVSFPQIQPVRPLSAISPPSVTITSVSTEARSIGRINVRSIATPPRNDSPSVRKNAPQYGTPHSISCHARKVENVAISPWAKLTTRVER